MGPVRIVVGDELAQDGAQVRLIQDNDVVEAVGCIYAVGN